MKRATIRYLKQGMFVVKDPGSVACMQDALDSDAAQKRTIRELRKALTVARNRFRWVEMGTFADECSAALKPRAKR